MLPWRSIIKIDKTSGVPVYLQFANALILEIKNGVLRPGTKIPGTRAMAELLKLNRQTVVRTYEELFAQGWITLLQSKGTFVSENLPEVTPRKFTLEETAPDYKQQTGFSFKINALIHPPAKPRREVTGFHDGPDVRLLPTELIGRGYKSVLNRKSGLLLLSYVEVEGRPGVRKAISDYLNSSRGLQTKEENIILTRGTQMAMYLLANVLITKGDLVVVADISFRYADLVFLHVGAQIVRVPVDENGLDVDQLEKVCHHKKIRAVYVTSHHHYPTTVILSAARRMKLLNLADQYKFIIIEDDYDYEFHFESSPILPLASADRNGMVVYTGSFSKTLSPAVRLGYVAAPSNLINELAKLRQIMDVQGDPILEQVIAELINEGEIRRHMKKALKVYRERRDHMCSLLKDKLGDIIDFNIPEGGLSIWAKYDKSIPLPQISDELRKKGVVLSNGLLHDKGLNIKLNSTRMGFGWMNLHEAEVAISVLHDTIKEGKY